MNINIEHLKLNDYKKLISTVKYQNKIPFWLNDIIIPQLISFIILIAKKRTELKGIWVVPINNENERIHARRTIRYFPYCSPVIFESNKLKRREIAFAFFNYLLKICNSISLPMNPKFDDLSIAQALGIFVEWRHTHIVNSKINENQLSSRFRNHLRNASKNADIYITKNLNKFNFDRAIKGNDEEKSKRKDLARVLLENDKALIINGIVNNDCHGGIFILIDNGSAYLYHSWFDKDKGLGGLMNYLIYTTINFLFMQENIIEFDFEGSILHDIDYFFSGFNSQTLPYGYLHWHKDPNHLTKMILESINIKGRLLNKT